MTGQKTLLSGNEAIALGTLHERVTFATGYPGTPSTEILERLAALGGAARWAPNEKVAFEVALGVAFARGGRALVTMKHVGLNVAADALFTAAYSGVAGALVIAVADDPGVASSQNEQDSRHYARAAAVPLLEPADPQEAYDFTRLAFRISETWGLPVLLRTTTRVSHTTGMVAGAEPRGPDDGRAFVRAPAERVMMPVHARPAHRRLRARLAALAAWNEVEGPNRIARRREGALGVICSGVAYLHAMEALPDAAILKIGMAHPLPVEQIRRFAAGVARAIVIEENDPVLADAIRAAGIPVERAPASYRFGELDVARVRGAVAGAPENEPEPGAGTPPRLCEGCPHRSSFAVLKELDCIVAGDIGCYTLAALPPLDAMDTQICMGASIGVGLGLRHALPEAEARRVVSVIGDSTLFHSGLTGLTEMVYNPPPTGHVVLVLDNGTTAMTGLQEHPGTGRSLDHRRARAISIEAVARAMGLDAVHVVNPVRESRTLRALLADALAGDRLTLIVARHPCVLAAGKIRAHERAIEQDCEHNPGAQGGRGP